MTPAVAPVFLTAADFTVIARAVTFEPTGHAYWVSTHGPMPSVTGILKAVGVSLDFERLIERGQLTRLELDEARAIGQAVHMATHYYDEGTLAASSVDPRAEQGLQNWIDWRALTGFVPVLLETPLWHPGLLIAGTVDRVGFFTKLETWQPHDLTTVDLKWGDPVSAGAQWQTMFYQEMVSLALAPLSVWAPGPAGLRIRPRYSVHLQGPRAALHRYGDGLRDWADCLAFVTTYRRQLARRRPGGPV